MLDAICFYAGILILASILEDAVNKLFGRYF